MNEPKRFDGEKYKRILALAEKVRENRPAEGEVIHKLVVHINELYEYIDFLRQGDCALDDDALLRLGIPEAMDAPVTPARSRRGRNTNPVQSPRHTVNRNTAVEGWQAARTDLSWLDSIQIDDSDPPF